MNKPKTLPEIFGCTARTGVEGSKCENCGGNHTVTEECLMETGIYWGKYYKALELPESIPEESREYAKGMVVDFIRYFFDLRPSEVENDEQNTD